MKKGNAVYLAFGMLLIALGAGALVFSEHAPKAPQLTAGVVNATTSPITTQTLPEPVPTYVEVVDSCGPDYSGSCVNMRSGPGTTYPSILKLRQGMVLRVSGIVNTAAGSWYQLDPGEGVRYPERITSAWYVSTDLVKPYTGLDEGELNKNTATTTKYIVVSVETQMLFAYDGDTLFMSVPISTGLSDTPTPHGRFTVFKKTPSRYMQGPIPGLSDQSYDLPGVPWDLYFTQDGAVIHGAYWHNHFGEPWSHGCVNLPLDAARQLYDWTPLGTPVNII